MWKPSGTDLRQLDTTALGKIKVHRGGKAKTKQNAEGETGNDRDSSQGKGELGSAQASLR